MKIMSFPRSTLNFLKIAKKTELRDLFLKPKGFDRQFGSQHPLPQREVDLLNWKLTLKRPGVVVDDNVACFEVEGKATKPEIKNYIEKRIYSLYL